MSELRGYDYSTISVKKIMKDKFVLSTEVEMQIAREELAEKMLTALNNDGQVYFISQKKVVCGVVIVGFEKYKASEFDLFEEKDQKKETAEKVMDEVVGSDEKLNQAFKNNKEEEKKQIANAYVLQGLYLSDDLKTKDQVIGHDLIEKLKSDAAFHNPCIKVIIWGNHIVADKTIGKTEDSAPMIGMCFGMCFGMMLGQLLFDNIALGMSMGMCVGLLLGLAYYSGADKKSVSENSDADKKSESEKEETRMR